MTSPYTRACRQTNFFDGEFVCKVPFFYFFFFFLPSPFSVSKCCFFALFVIVSSGSMAKVEEGPSDYTGEIAGQF